MIGFNSNDLRLVVIGTRYTSMSEQSYRNSIGVRKNLGYGNDNFYQMVII